MKKAGQRSFAAGAFAAEAPSQIPTIGALDLLNFVLDDEATPRRRGGCSYVTTSPNATANALPWEMWDGLLAGGQRTVLSGPWFGTTIADVAGTGLSIIDGASAIAAPSKPIVLGGMLISPQFFGASSGGRVYGGSRKTGDYTTGTVTAVVGSKAVVGVGTAWLANVDAGGLLTDNAAAPGNHPHAIESVDSDTTLTLAEPWSGPALAGAAYRIERTSTVPLPVPWFGAAGRIYMCVAGERLVMGRGREIVFSDGPDPTTGGLRPWSRPAANRHTLPAGAEIRAMAALRDRVFALTSVGVFVISNMAYEIVDSAGTPQHRIEYYSQDVIALESGAGITTFKDALVVPAVDDIYLMDGLAAPEPITRSVRRDWRSGVKAGSKPGNAAIYRGHYVVPLVSAAGVAQGTWLFKLDAPVETSRGVVYPWTRWDSQAGLLGAVAVRDGVPRALLGAGVSSGPTRARVLDLTAGFDTAPTASTDADGTAVAGVITTRDFAGGGLRTLFRFLRARYRLSDAAGSESVAAEVSTGGDSSSSWTSIGSAAPVAELAQGRWTWPLQRMAEYVRFRLTVTGGDEFVLHELEVEFEEPGR